MQSLGLQRVRQLDTTEETEHIPPSAKFEDFKILQGVADSQFRTISIKYNPLQYSFLGFPGGSAVKNSPSNKETQVWSLGQEDPLEKKMATHSSTLAWKFHGQRSWEGYSPWGCKESDMI